jgi:hypothetical protein
VDRTGEQVLQAEVAASTASARRETALAVAALGGWRSVVCKRRATVEAIDCMSQRRTAQLLQSAFAEWRALLQVLTSLP